jgi:hypothetical protein
MLTEEKINLNFVTFIDKLTKYNAYPKSLEDDEEFKKSLKNASAFIQKDSGGAYEGSLIEHINHVALIAYNINNMLSDSVKVPLNSLIRSCYLQQISKALMIEKNTSEYEIGRGKLFRFKDNLPALKCGEYSILLCNKYGIELKENEYEAILSVDKINDEQTKYFGSMLSLILKQANELAIAEMKAEYKLNIKK